MKRPLSNVLAAATLVAGLTAGFAADAQFPPPQPVAPVEGVLIDGRTGTPAPGLLVSLIHPVLGRSAPSFTDPYGRYGWFAIPMRPEPYYLEVYWGPNLIFRQQLRVGGPVRLPPIRL